MFALESLVEIFPQMLRSAFVCTVLSLSRNSASKFGRGGYTVRPTRWLHKEKIAGSETLIVIDRARRGVRPGENAHHQIGSFQALKVQIFVLQRRRHCSSTGHLLPGTLKLQHTSITSIPPLRPGTKKAFFTLALKKKRLYISGQSGIKKLIRKRALKKGWLRFSRKYEIREPLQ